MKLQRPRPPVRTHTCYYTPVRICLLGQTFWRSHISFWCQSLYYFFCLSSRSSCLFLLSVVMFDYYTRSQAVARIADRTASQHRWGSCDVVGNVTIR